MRGRVAGALLLSGAIVTAATPADTPPLGGMPTSNRSTPAVALAHASKRTRPIASGRSQIARTRPRASRYTTYEQLDRVASILALRPAHVWCSSEAEWRKDPLAKGDWGYVIVYEGPDDTAIVNPLICRAALAIPAAATDEPTGLEDWQLAIAALIITHESYHIRLWDLNGDEAAVECRAIRHFAVAMRLLGGSPALAARLLPWALAFHFRMGTLHAEYRSPHCKTPWPY
jgi:hypothetical protein